MIIPGKIYAYKQKNLFYHFSKYIPDYLQEIFDNEVPITTALSEILEVKTALSQKTTEMQVIAESNRKLTAKSINFTKSWKKGCVIKERQRRTHQA